MDEQPLTFRRAVQCDGFSAEQLRERGFVAERPGPDRRPPASPGGPALCRGAACRTSRPLAGHPGLRPRARPGVLHLRLADTQYPPPQCPYLDSPRGLLLNIGERFADGSIRLVRDEVVESPAWEQLYHRGRNAVEGRNAKREQWDQKRLPVYGPERGKSYAFLSDVWDNLTTLARLVREATAATGYRC